MRVSSCVCPSHLIVCKFVQYVRRSGYSRETPARVSRTYRYCGAQNRAPLSWKARRRLPILVALHFHVNLFVAAEDNLNISLKDITVTGRDGRVSQLDQVYIRGSMVRFFIVPDMLQNAPMYAA